MSSGACRGLQGVHLEGSRWDCGTGRKGGEQGFHPEGIAGRARRVGICGAIGVQVGSRDIALKSNWKSVVSLRVDGMIIKRFR